MKLFLHRILLFFISIVVLTISLYLITDVFKIFYHYDPYYDINYPVSLNRAYGTTMTYTNQNPKYHYDSYILGNSRSLLYEIDTWKKYLPANSRCMHFDRWVCTIKGLYEMIKFIDDAGGELNNALIVLDHEMCGDFKIMENKDYMYSTPPNLGGHQEFFNFHFLHFKAFLNFQLWFNLVVYKIYGKYHPLMKEILNDPQRISYISEYNEFQETGKENEIKHGIYYNTEVIKGFNNVQKPKSFSKEQLDNQEIEYLERIKRIFDRHHTSYKIVISPLYDQIKLNKETYNTLCKIFKKESLYDFSGVNKWNKDYHNYYERSHYRPIVSAEIMDIVYRINQNTEKDR